MRFNSYLKGGGPPRFKFPFGPSVEEVVPIDLHHQPLPTVPTDLGMHLQ